MGVGLTLHAADEKPARKGDSRQPVQTSKCSDVPSHPFDLILGRPTANSVTVSVLCYEDAEGFIAYGTQPGKPAARTPARPFKKGEPVEIMLSPLQPNTRYFCQLQSAPAGSGEFTFHTARPPGSTFTFTVTADSHLDDRTDPALYQRTLAGALADAPDFHIDLGDTFMTEKHDSRENAARQYLAQRFYFGQLCQSAPLFLVLGNHDGESPRGRGSDADSLAVWSSTMRKRYFPNPVPDSFYTGNATKHPEAGLLQDYYAWEWGDGLFVVLDPFWFTEKQRGQSDNWKRTLGAEQYQWLKRTLEASTAKFKFVFTHHLVGGAEDQCRGGAEAAPFFEWGGKNADGRDGFQQNRPGWPAPIHQLLVQNRVTIVFHGHDHFYARQDLDGIVYQEVPQPGTQANGRTPRNAAEYGYRDGVILGGSGHLRVTVSPNKLTADYVRAGVPTAEDAGGRNRQVAHSYTLASPAVGQEATPPQREERRAQRTGKQGRPKGGAAEHTLPPDVVALGRLSLVLGRPTDKAVTVSVLSSDVLEGYCEYGLASSDYTRKTGVVGFSSGKAVDVVLDQLPPDKQCFYRLRYRKPGENAFAEGAEHSFHTQRAPGRMFLSSRSRATRTPNVRSSSILRSTPRCCGLRRPTAPTSM
jgi:predicted phosphodiesterase